MAVIDLANDAIVIRVVYDGPPMAGKTTSVRALARGVGGTLSASEEIEGRTLYFDWLDYTGGLFEGRRIRCQIISVPGQASLASRRRRLLETADVVVFVGDSTIADHSATANYLEGLRAVLARLDGPPVGIVYQANKRDRPDATSLRGIRDMLDAGGARIGLVESVAVDGSGVREAFVFAVRLALDRVRELMRANLLRIARPDVDNAQQLLDDLRRAEGSTLDLAAASGLAHTHLHEVRDATLAEQSLRRVVQGNDAATQASVWAAPEPSAVATRREPAPDTAPPQIPGSDLPSGMIWPPVHGRLILHEATSASTVLQQQSDGDWIGNFETQWQWHSPASACFASLDAGREALVSWARLHAASSHAISSERCVVLSRDGLGRYRLWQIVRNQATLRDDFNVALREGAPSIARNLLGMTQAFLLAAERLASAACWLPLSLRNVGILPGGVYFLGPMPDPQNVRTPAHRTADAVLKLLTVQLEFALPDIDACRDDAIRELEQLIGNGPNDPVRRFARQFLEARAA